MEKRIGRAKGKRADRKPLSMPVKILVVSGYALIASLVLILTVTGAGPYDVPAEARALEGVLAESRRLGYPMTQADLKPNPVPPKEMNAALTVVPLARKLPRFPDDLRSSDSDRRRESEEAVVAGLAEGGATLDQIVSALETKPEWFIDRDYDMGFFLEYREYGVLKDAAKWLGERATKFADRGDFERSVRDLRAMYLIGNRLSQNADTFALYDSIAVSSIAMASVERVAEAAADEPGVLSKIESVVIDTKHTPDPRATLRFEFYERLAVARNLDHYGGLQFLWDPYSSSEEPPDKAELVRSGEPKTMLYRAQMTPIARIYNGAMRQLDSGATKGWGKAMDDASVRASNRLRVSERLLLTAGPYIGRFERTLQVHEVNTALAIALVRVLRFRALKGRMPRSLAEADAEFDDPFSSGRLLSLLGPDEIRVWSVGDNGIDEDGLPRNSSRSDDPGVYWPSAKRRDLALPP